MEVEAQSEQSRAHVNAGADKVNAARSRAMTGSSGPAKSFLPYQQLISRSPA
jgi:hypothetical protein